MHSSLSLRSILASDEKSYCDALGYKHMPYTWIEEVCEEMLEEKLGKHTICMLLCIVPVFRTGDRIFFWY